MTNTQLKIIALIAMFIDHTGSFIPNTPEWYRWIGRIAAPIFIYCIVVGYNHTSNKSKYLTRLFIAAVGMELLNLFINSWIQRMYYLAAPVYYYEFLSNNFFASLFLIALLMMLLEQKKIMYITLFIVWQTIATLLIVYTSIKDLLTFPSFLLSITLFGNVFFVEGGFFIILLGLLFYYTYGDKRKTALGYSFFSFLLFFAVRRWGWRRDAPYTVLLPFADYQWMMIAALPFILLDNGKKGIGLKYFFYIFYPVHIVILFLLGFNWERN